MNRCPITYEPCKDQKYSKQGLALLGVKELHDFPYTSKQQVQLAVELASKISIQGVQPKISAILSVINQVFEVVETGGRFIIKPPHQVYDELPQNEDLSMKLAKSMDIEVPLHGLMYNKDGSFSYFIKRFDRLPKGGKVAVEDFSQLLNFSRDTKYEASMEKVVAGIDKHCTFPLIEKARLFRLTLFNFLIGNEDMHLKNFSLIRREGKVELCPAYDLLNTTIVLKAQEEIALPIRGKKSRINRVDLIEYFGKERLGLPEFVLQKELKFFGDSLDRWKALIEVSFLSPSMQQLYKNVIDKRWAQLA